MIPETTTTPTPSVYIAASTAGPRLRARAHYAAMPTEDLPAIYQMSREEAARRCGIRSRSWIYRFLADNADRIPPEFLPGSQLVVNRVPVGFVRWFLAEGHRLPYRPKPAAGSSITGTDVAAPTKR